AVATTPVGLPGLCRSSAPASTGLPPYPNGSAPMLFFSRHARRSLALRPACVLSRLSRPFFIGVLQRNSLPPFAAPTASGWNYQLPCGTLTHWRSPSLHGTPDSPDKRGIGDLVAIDTRKGYAPEMTTDSDFRPLGVRDE